jgi:hypothetical protein
MVANTSMSREGIKDVVNVDVIMPPLQSIHSSKAQTISTTHPNVHVACMRA